ncbi:polyprenyl synthetase family protein [Sciscionella sediminilitoris]|uniref:polyprenyl synthetase family protein n=1 Tax=Sciscionella sediminilitoris TaxID=1445613 RepID=UPI0005658BE6|nr:polyprenyl synthetase family protein [Sciscionella sp. SE31]
MTTPDDRLPLDEIDPDLAASIRRGLVRIEETLHEAVASEVELLSESARHLADAGGKRIRPLLTLLGAQFGEPGREDVYTAAAAVELVHLATLYHDDVVDEAEIRRGAASANARWDNTVAILTGDFLFAKASLLVSDLGTDAARIIAETFSELVTGELRETIGPEKGEDPTAHYLSVIGQKTGSLIATAGRFGGMCSGAEGKHVEALREYGEVIGAAFQISDDIIDILSPSTESGKIPGTDLREGVHTLPMLYALTAEDTDPRLVELLSGPITEDAAVEEALALLRGSSGIRRAQETLQNYSQRALDVLELLPDVPARAALRWISHYVVERTS